MKKLFLLSCMVVASLCKVSAYTTVTVQDSISTNAHWTCDQQYLLKGYVYVTAGATLTIDAGTIIKGDKNTKGALIVERGAKIMAMGTLGHPIVFTSNQDPGTRTYGDWGGVILCGKATVNWNGGEATVEGGPRSKYGGQSTPDDHDNSGEMHYVRIEFAGIAFSPNNEVNGLTFCGVGDATQVDHIQVSYSGDDSYEWFGGRVNAKYLVSFRSWDDDFDTDNGFQGKVQFGAIIRDPYSADQSGSKAFESDSYQSGTYTGLTVDNTMITKPIFSNITAIGPIINPASTGAYDPQFVAGAHIRRGSSISILNSVFAGWPCGVLIDESSASFGSTTGNITSNELQFRNNIISGSASVNPPTAPAPKDVLYVKDGARSLTPTTAWGDTTTGTPFNPYAGPYTWIKEPSFKNWFYTTEQTGVRLGSPFNLSIPNLVPTSTSPIVYNASHAFNPASPVNFDTTAGYAHYNVPANYPDYSAASKASDAFFDKVNYIGAFSGTGSTSDNWMNGWCEFNPVDADYDQTCYVAPPPPVDDAVAHLSAFEGAKVFPNPAKENAILMLEVKKTTAVNVTVFDVTGKKVMDVFNGSVTAGNQTFQFSTNELSNGMYIISISAENKHKTLKLNIAK